MLFLGNFTYTQKLHKIFKFLKMTFFSLITFWFLVMSSSPLATTAQSRINVTLVGSVFIRDGTNTKTHFVPKIYLLGSQRYQVIWGFPSAQLNWTMWRAENNPEMLIFGIEINSEWYFLQVRANGESMIVVRQSIPDMVSTNSSRWFEYVKDYKRPGMHFLYHQRTHSYIRRVNNTIALSRNSETASAIEIG